MSTVDQKRGWTEALAAAEAFRDLFAGCFERWEFGGSIRRKCREVADAEHVVIPRIIDRAGDDLFGGTKPVNLLLERADRLAGEGKVARHIYPNGTQRWGERYRGMDFGYLGLVTLNEVFCAGVDNWGPTLAIRTGPADFSRKLVTSLQWHGHMNDGGYVWDKRRMVCACGWGGTDTDVEWVTEWEGKAFIKDPDGRDGGPFAAKCPQCLGTSGMGLTRVSVPDEETYFALAGIPFTRPEDRR